MPLMFFNTMNRRKEEFKPIDGDKVRMYTCGPTIYNYAHIGNLRTFMFEDILRRYLLYKGYRLTHVMNLTDIDDKTIKGSREQGISLGDYTAKYKQAFFDDLDTLNIQRAEVYPAATEHIPEMVQIIRKLLDDGYAYEMGGSIYYKISAFAGYGRLSHMKMDELKVGARVASDEYEKDQVSDFALWKGWDEDDGNVFWETEIGKGRPGWHIECSAMSMKYLGEHFDIHTGAVDNIFPHHENEIAQSEAATGKPFANYWLHSLHLIVDGRKMAKSLNNFFTMPQLLEKGYAPRAIRYCLISTHYRQQLNFTFDGLTAAANSLERYYDFISNLGDVTGETDGGEADGFISGAAANFEKAMDDDLNISEALGVVFDYIRDINRLKAESRLSRAEAVRALDLINRFDSVLGLQIGEEETIDAGIEGMIEARIEARKNKNWAESDRIRDELLAQGIILEDTPSGTKWKRKI
ncbi:MAG: cysteine--tRNA ligase [FCB group bacterium]|nr:cysteine--tRNA ligase [FCB group bacterium]